MNIETKVGDFIAFCDRFKCSLREREMLRDHLAIFRLNSTRTIELYAPEAPLNYEI